MLRTEINVFLFFSFAHTPRLKSFQCSIRYEVFLLSHVSLLLQEVSVLRNLMTFDVSIA